MAFIRLDDREAHHLPDVCMKCGQPADDTVNKSFSWTPPWVGILILAGLLPYIIVSLILTKRMAVTVPLCSQHKGHWWVRTLIIVLSLLVVLGLGFGGLMVMIALEERGGRMMDDVMPFVCVGGGVGLLLWLILVMILQNTAIRPQEITDYTISLTNVSPEFVEAVEERRDRDYDDDDDDDDDEYRSRRRPRPRR